MVASSLRRPAGGFTLVELLVVLAVLALLASIAGAAFQHVVMQARRGDGIAALLHLQLAQERHRAQHHRYGSLAELRLPDGSPDGRYLVLVSAAEADAFEARVVATGAQARDAACRHLVLRVDAAHARHASGPDASAGNAEAANRRCWRHG
jgi:type IV pilus assembly protein PilE